MYTTPPCKSDIFGYMNVFVFSGLAFKRHNQMAEYNSYESGPGNYATYSQPPPPLSNTQGGGGGGGGGGGYGGPPSGGNYGNQGDVGGGGSWSQNRSGGGGGYGNVQGRLYKKNRPYKNLVDISKGMVVEVQKLRPLIMSYNIFG